MLACVRPRRQLLQALSPHRSLSTAQVAAELDTDKFGAPPRTLCRRVVVTGLGLVTPLAVGVDKTWKRLLAGETGVRGLTEADLPEGHRKCYADLPSKVAACVSHHELHSVPWAVQADARRQAPFVTYALGAAAEALQAADWHPSSPEDKAATGVAIGVGMSSTQDIADAGVLVSQGKIRRINPFFVPRMLANMAAGAVSIQHGLQGPNHTASTACTTGAHSIGDAFRMIRDGDADVMVAGGSESCIDAISIGGFGRMKALSTKFNDQPEKASRPFDKDRDGFVIGEGAGMVVLEEQQHALQRGANIIAELNDFEQVRGYGLSGDANHITQPAPDGIGARLAMQRAMQAAGAKHNDIAYINAHATSTPMGDAVEQQAIAEVFGKLAAPSESRSNGHVCVSSTKGATGHLLGAAGAVEAIFTVLAIRDSVAPPTVNLVQPEPCMLGYFVLGQAQKLHAGHKMAMTNSFGFGGTNASLVFATPPA